MSKQNFYIQLGGDNGGPITHPMLEENLMDIIPNFDPKNPPQNIVKFIKTEPPVLQGEERYDYLDYAHSPTLSKKHGQTVWHEVHHIKRITQQERDDIIKKFKELNPELSDWIYDTATATLVPPIPKPVDNKNYYWDIYHKTWIESTHDLHLDDMMEVAKELGHDLTKLGANTNLSQDEVRKIVDKVTKGQQKRPPKK